TAYSVTRRSWLLELKRLPLLHVALQSPRGKQLANPRAEQVLAAVEHRVRSPLIAAREAPVVGTDRLEDAPVLSQHHTEQRPQQRLFQPAGQQSLARGDTCADLQLAGCCRHQPGADQQAQAPVAITVFNLRQARQAKTSETLAAAALKHAGNQPGLRCF